MTVLHAGRKVARDHIYMHVCVCVRITTKANFSGMSNHFLYLSAVKPLVLEIVEIH